MTDRRTVVRSFVLSIATIAAAGLSGSGCAADPADLAEPVAETVQAVDTSQFPATFARQWMTNLANSVKTEGISPPVAARTYTYGAIGIYESVVHGMPGYKSLAGQLNGLGSLPMPDPGLEYDWPTVLAHTMDRFVTSGMYTFPNPLFYETITSARASLESLGRVQIGYRQASGVAQSVIDNSIAYGDALADTLIPWAEADGYYDARYKGFIPPKGPQYWVPTGFANTDVVTNPLEPYFGTLRPLVLTSPGECAPPPPPAFSTDPASDMYAQANTVYQTESNLNDMQREIANFWADGPGATATPAGHWVAIANKFLRPKNLAEAAAGYAYTSLGYFDSFIAIWQSKYTYNVLRPETYIRRYIDPGWRPFLPTPQFPSYTSGHSGVSAAAAVLFTQQFGGAGFTDDTKLRRGFAARSFANFMGAAQEAADSRIYGGIHYPMDDSLTLGLCVGNAIKSRVTLQLPP